MKLCGVGNCLFTSLFKGEKCASAQRVHKGKSLLLLLVKTGAQRNILKWQLQHFLISFDERFMNSLK